MNKKVLVLGIMICMSLTSCGVMGVVSTPSEYTSGGKEVSAVKNNTNILTLTPMDAEVASDELLQDLKGQCSNGVKNIKTSHSIKSYYVVAMEKMEISGNCK